MVKASYNRRKSSRDSFYGIDYGERRVIAFKRIFYEEKGNDNNWNIILHNNIGVVYTTPLLSNIYGSPRFIVIKTLFALLFSFIELKAPRELQFKYIIRRQIY